MASSLPLARVTVMGFTAVLVVLLLLLHGSEETNHPSIAATSVPRLEKSRNPTSPPTETTAAIFATATEGVSLSSDRMNTKEQSRVPRHQGDHEPASLQPTAPTTSVVAPRGFKHKRLFAVGDSLTAGAHWANRGRKLSYAPYSAGLAAKFGVERKSVGLPGWTSVSVSNHVIGHKDDFAPFDLCLIMIGTNDLIFMSVTTEETVRAIRRLVQWCAKERGAQTFVLQLLPANFPRGPHKPLSKYNFCHPKGAFGPDRERLNARLVEAFGSKDPGRVINMGAILPHDDAHKGFWADCVHYNVNGSAVIAEGLYQHILPYMS